MSASTTNHEWEYSHSVFGISYFVCAQCKKKLSEYDWEKDDSVCTVSSEVDSDYSSGFSFVGKTDSEIRQILSSGNRDYLGRSR